MIVTRRWSFLFVFLLFYTIIVIAPARADIINIVFSRTKYHIFRRFKIIMFQIVRAKMISITLI